MGAFGLKLKHSRWILRSCGLQPLLVDLHNGCRIHCWAPSPTSDPTLPPPQPALLFLHGFGADGTIAWESQVPAFAKHFAVFLPDLLFFGDSIIAGSADDSSALPPDCTENQKSRDKHPTTKKVRYSEVFQAQCMHEALSKLGVQEAVVVGHSYGGFVAYFMAHLYPSFVKRLVLVSSGIMMDSHTNDNLLQQLGASSIHDVLVPPTLAHFKKSFQFTLNYHFLTWLPSCLFKEMYEVLGGDRQMRLQLVDDVLLDKEDAPPLPSIEQSTLVVWGDQDQIFDISLAYKLKDFLGSRAQLHIINGVSHVPQLSNPSELNKLLLTFIKQP